MTSQRSNLATALRNAPKINGISRPASSVGGSASAPKSISNSAFSFSSRVTLTRASSSNALNWYRTRVDERVSSIGTKTNGDMRGFSLLVLSNHFKNPSARKSVLAPPSSKLTRAVRAISVSLLSSSASLQVEKTSHLACAFASAASRSPSSESFSANSASLGSSAAGLASFEWITNDFPSANASSSAAISAHSSSSVVRVSRWLSRRLRSDRSSSFSFQTSIRVLAAPSGTASGASLPVASLGSAERFAALVKISCATPVKFGCVVDATP
jgi:hypothetical protein